jgi:hypothetical protein
MMFAVATVISHRVAIHLQALMFLSIAERHTAKVMVGLRIAIQFLFVMAAV